MATVINEALQALNQQSFNFRRVMHVVPSLSEIGIVVRCPRQYCLHLSKLNVVDFSRQLFKIHTYMNTIDCLLEVGDYAYGIAFFRMAV